MPHQPARAQRRELDARDRALRAHPVALSRCRRQHPDMTPPPHRSEFLQRLAVAGGATVMSACARNAATVESTLAPARSQTRWDMSWTSKLARYKTAYDAPEILTG